MLSLPPKCNFDHLAEVQKGLSSADGSETLVLGNQASSYLNILRTSTNDLAWLKSVYVFSLMKTAPSFQNLELLSLAPYSTGRFFHMHESFQLP